MCTRYQVPPPPFPVNAVGSFHADTHAAAGDAHAAALMMLMLSSSFLFSFRVFLARRTLLVFRLAFVCLCLRHHYCRRPDAIAASHR